MTSTMDSDPARVAPAEISEPQWLRLEAIIQRAGGDLEKFRGMREVLAAVVGG